MNDDNSFAFKCVACGKPTETEDSFCPLCEHLADEEAYDSERLKDSNS